jgi:acylphosphatase
MITRHLLISGRVQGVGYRAWMVQEAEKLGLRGWVRNLNDGRVEAMVHGAESDVETMIRQAWRGPAAAQVNNVAIEETKTYDGPSQFETRLTDHACG